MQAWVKLNLKLNSLVFHHSNLPKSTFTRRWHFIETRPKNKILWEWDSWENKGSDHETHLHEICIRCHKKQFGFMPSQILHMIHNRHKTKSQFNLPLKASSSKNNKLRSSICRHELGWNDIVEWNEVEWSWVELSWRMFYDNILVDFLMFLTVGSSFYENKTIFIAQRKLSKTAEHRNYCRMSFQS